MGKEDTIPRYKAIVATLLSMCKERLQAFQGVDRVYDGPDDIVLRVVLDQDIQKILQGRDVSQNLLELAHHAILLHITLTHVKVADNGVLEQGLMAIREKEDEEVFKSLDASVRAKLQTAKKQPKKRVKSPTPKRKPKRTPKRGRR